MSSVISLCLPAQMLRSLDRLSKTIKYSRAYFIKKALKAYLMEYGDYHLALERLRDKNDIILPGRIFKRKLNRH